MTYEDDHTMLTFLTIFQGVLWSCQCLCCWIPCCSTPINNDIYDEAEMVGRDSQLEDGDSKQEWQVEEKVVDE